MSFICKQPNGLYCRFSTVVDCPTDWNMTKDDYAKVIYDRNPEKGIKYAKYEADDIIKNHLYPFDMISKYFIDNNMSQEEFEKFLEDCKTT